MAWREDLREKCRLENEILVLTMVQFILSMLLDLVAIGLVFGLKLFFNSLGNHTFLEDFVFSTHHCCQFFCNPEAQRKMYSSPMDPVLYYLWYNTNFNNVCNTICKCPTKFHDSHVEHNFDIFSLLHHPIYCAMDLCGL